MSVLSVLEATTTLQKCRKLFSRIEKSANFGVRINFRRFLKSQKVKYLQLHN